MTHTEEFEWQALLRSKRALIGMVHVAACPGTPGHSLPVDEMIERACEEAIILKEAGFDAVMLENMHDTPYVHGSQLGPEVTAVMTAVAREVRRNVKGPIGVQILSGGNRQAIATSLVAGAAFIRCENFVFSHVADEGVLPEAEAGRLLRYRNSIGANHLGVFCDIKKKHASHAMTGDLSIGDVAEAAAFFRADALIVTGAHTGHAANTDEVRVAAERSGLPVLVGSGAVPESLGKLFEHASGVIVGSGLKHEGRWQNPVDAARASKYVMTRDQL